MKVTKLIREYVEEQVSKAYNAKENPYSKQAELDRQKIKDFGAELRYQQQKAIDTFTAETELFEVDYRGGFRNSLPCANVPNLNYYMTQAMIDERKWKDENTRQKNSKIREIMIALELGANRQELNDMIAKLLEDIND